LFCISKFGKKTVRGKKRGETKWPKFGKGYQDRHPKFAYFFPVFVVFTSTLSLFSARDSNMGNQSSAFTQKELKHLQKRFKKLDKDRSGLLEPEEFFDLPELAQNPLVKRVISVFDVNKDGKISFIEFVSGLSALSSQGSEEEKMKFAFAIYDLDGDGFISNGELFSVLKMMVGNNLNDIQLQQLVDRTVIKADEDFDGKLSYDEFCKMVKDLDVVNKLTIQW